MNKCWKEYLCKSLFQNEDIFCEDLTDPNNQLFGTGQVRGDDAGLPGARAAALKYPLDMSSQQDHIEFKMMEYSLFLIVLSMMEQIH